MDDKPKVAVNWDYVPSDAIAYLIDQYIHHKRNRAILKAHFSAVTAWAVTAAPMVMAVAAMSADIPAITLILKSVCARWLTRPRTMPPA